MVLGPVQGADGNPDQKEPPNTYALDRTAMSAGLGISANSWLPAALMAVGQLGR